jgi:ubiquinone/menaquinone biosynthesis C-methylase UbiE
MRIVHSLCENAESYYEKAGIYDLFSQAEDYPGKVFRVLKQVVKGKVVLDVGCGTGKYLKLLAPCCKKIIGVDVSADQLAIARREIGKLTNVELIHAPADKIKLKSGTTEVVIGAWFLGSIVGIRRKKKILHKLESILNDTGTIYLIENDVGSEFERIRQGVSNPLRKALEHNQWLLDKMGFKVFKRIKTYFKFKNVNTARSVIWSIWGRRAADKVHCHLLFHNVIIFKKVS